MAYSINIVVLSGTTDVVSVPFPFIARSHVRVKVGDEVITSQVQWLTNGTIKLPQVYPAGTVCRVSRHTPAAEMLVRFTSPDEMSGDEINTGLVQLLYIVQEAFDLTAGLQDGLADLWDILQRIIQMYEQIVAMTQTNIELHQEITAIYNELKTMAMRFDLAAYQPDVSAVGDVVAVYALPEPLQYTGVVGWRAFCDDVTTAELTVAYRVGSGAWVPLGKLTFTDAATATASPIAAPLTIPEGSPLRITVTSGSGAGFATSISLKRTTDG